MGWDAYAVNAINQTVSLELSRHNPKFSKHRQAFLLASRRVNAVSYSVDGLLASGGLDCNDCAKMLEKATGLSVWTKPWSVEDINTIDTKANWDFEIHYQDRWAYYSAKMFLHTCAELKLGIKFSF